MSNTIDKQKLLEAIDEIIGSPFDHEKIILLYYPIKEGKFDSPSTERLREALEQIINVTKSRKFDFLIIQHVYKIAREALSEPSGEDREEKLQCEDCGKPWKMGDPTKEIEVRKIKTVCKDCF